MTAVHAIVENVSRRGVLKGMIAGGSRCRRTRLLFYRKNPDNAALGHIVAEPEILL